MDADRSARDKDTLHLPLLVKGNLGFRVQRTNEYKWKASTKKKPAVD